MNGFLKKHDSCIYRCLYAILASAFAFPLAAADSNPTHVAADAAQALNTLTGDARVRIVWVQKQFISDDTTAYLDCGSDYVNWLYVGGPGTKMIGFDSRDGEGIILDETTDTHVKPVFDKTGKFVFWNELVNNTSWVMSWDGSVKKTLLTGSDYIVLCTWYEESSGKEYVFTAEKQSYDEHLLAVRNIYRYEFDIAEASVVTGSKTLMWNKSNVHAPFNVAADGIHAAGNMPWPNSYIAELPNGDYSQYNADGAWSCHANIAPDNSLRVFHMDEPHRQIAVFDGSQSNSVWIPIITKLPTVDINWQCNGPHWTNDIQYLTIFAPYLYWGTEAWHDCTQSIVPSDWKDGESGEIYFGKFNSLFTDAEFIRITDGDWRFRKAQADAWVSTGEGTGETGIAARPGAVQRMAEVPIARAGNCIVLSLPGDEHALAEIISASGRIMLCQAMTHGQAQISIADWPRGVYAVRLSGSGMTAFKKIVLK